jgi:hypothetical protein
MVSPVTAIAAERHAITGPHAGPGGPAGDQLSASQAVPDRPAVRRTKTARSWPLLVLAAPAAAEVWSGWVGIAQKTGFGQVSPLPGIWPSLHLDTAITLPVGVEAYAAYALRAWLARDHPVSNQTRRFAKWSAICSLALGMAGQVAYHLLAQAGAARAPWPVTAIVSCLPVLVLAMGTTLAHMLRADAAAADQPDGQSRGPAEVRSPRRSTEDQLADHPGRHQDQDHGPGADQRPEQVLDQQARTRTTAGPSSPPRTSAPAPPAVPPHAAGRAGSSPPGQGEAQASLIALRLVTAGKPVSRRALRNGGVKGSNASLSALARQLNAESASKQAAVP